MMGDSQEKLVDRIRKLLALAGNNPSEAEAGAAMERAAALMAEHNLTLAEVETLGTENERIEERYQGKRARQTWARSIWGAVARLNLCLYYYQTPSTESHLERVAGGKTRWVGPHTGDLHQLIGTRANVVSTQVMAQYLVDTVERLARECPDIHGMHAHHAFKLGCARRLADRIRRLREDRMYAEQTTAPAPHSGGQPIRLPGSYQIHDAANQMMFLEVYGYHLAGGGYRPTTSNSHAYSRGQRAGEQIGLDAQAKQHQRLLTPPSR
jgi:hypothetical protein